MKPAAALPNELSIHDIVGRTGLSLQAPIRLPSGLAHSDAWVMALVNLIKVF